MSRFVKIETLFSNVTSRTLESLSAVYENKDCLKEVINRLVNNTFTNGVIKGKRILVKPNWVTHSTISTDDLCLRTHDQFLITVVEIILDRNPSQILIGDAPIQGCNWEKVISPFLVNEVVKLSEKSKIPIEIVDFRRATFNPSDNNPITERRPLTDYLIFDVGNESFLEPITSEFKHQFRVTNYNPDRLEESHRPGSHKYCIAKEFFDAEVVISLPKVKTHQKTGITAALKNLIGINGDKDFLPHHRRGGTGFGGDCYPGKNLLRFYSELSLDYANRHQGKFMYWFGYKLSSLLWRLSLPGDEHDLAAAWYGNDTTWRMVLDINKIAVFGKKDGSIALEPQRLLFSLCDGIIGGQGNGPLKPEPLSLGIICFSNDSAANDVCLATIMGFNHLDIPLIRNADLLLHKESMEIYINGNRSNLLELKKIAINTIPPPGWVKYFDSKRK